MKKKKARRRKRPEDEEGMKKEMVSERKGGCCMQAHLQHAIKLRSLIPSQLRELQCSGCARHSQRERKKKRKKKKLVGCQGHSNGFL